VSVNKVPLATDKKEENGRRQGRARYILNLLLFTPLQRFITVPFHNGMSKLFDWLQQIKSRFFSR
jgi:hypothetical protein